MPSAFHYFGDEQKQKNDEPKRDFWVPVRKLFAGPECLTGINLKHPVYVRSF